MRFQKKLVARALLGYSRATLANWYWSTQFDLGNFERGEIVSPRGSNASKVSGLNLATPDARHRRPLKSFIPSKCKKATPVLVPKAEMSVKKCPTSVRRVGTPGIPRGICISHLFLRKRRNEVLEKMLERHWSADPHGCPQSPFSMSVISEKPIEKPEKAGWKIHPVLKIDPQNTQFCPWTSSQNRSEWSVVSSCLVVPVESKSPRWTPVRAASPAVQRCEGRSQELNGDLTWRGVLWMSTASNSRLSAPKCRPAVTALLFRLRRRIRLHELPKKTIDDFNRKGLAVSSVFEMTR